MTSVDDDYDDSQCIVAFKHAERTRYTVSLATFRADIRSSLRQFLAAYSQPRSAYEEPLDQTAFATYGASTIRHFHRTRETCCHVAAWDPAGAEGALETDDTLAFHTGVFSVVSFALRASFLLITYIVGELLQGVAGGR